MRAHSLNWVPYSKLISEMVHCIWAQKNFCLLLLTSHFLWSLIESSRKSYDFLNAWCTSGWHCGGGFCLQLQNLLMFCINKIDYTDTPTDGCLQTTLASLTASVNEPKSMYTGPITLHYWVRSWANMKDF